MYRGDDGKQNRGSLLDMRRDLAALKGQAFDLLVIGGGINGAGVARDAAMRGLKVALVERHDFASGTSSRSSKLVHGGIRYLEQYEFHLVREASRERRLLLRLAPHLVRPLPFIIPIYQGDKRGPQLIRLGLWLYDGLALFRNSHRGQMLSSEHALRLEPAMRADGLRAAALYYDAQMDDARLCLANVTSAVEHGAAAANYVKVTSLDKVNGRAVGARVKDELSGETFSISASRVINVAGPWLDEVSELDTHQPSMVRLTKGTHIFVPPLVRSHAITIPSTDGRVIFVIPYPDATLIGTTDTDYEGDPTDVQPTADEVGYLLGEVRRIIPQHSLAPDAVISSFAGVRPLTRDDGVAAARVSREHKIFESPSGVISLAGGKYTTYREIAEQLVDRVSAIPCCTHLEPLPGGDVEDFSAYCVEESARLGAAYGLDEAEIAELLNAYGTRTDAVLGGPAWGDSLEARVRYAVKEEMAFSLEDVMRRRTRLAFGRGRGMGMADGVSHLMAPLLGWDEEERRQQIAAYVKAVGMAQTVTTGET